MWNVYKREIGSEYQDIGTYFVAGFDLEYDVWEEAIRLDASFPFPGEYHFVRYEQ